MTFTLDAQVVRFSPRRLNAAVRRQRWRPVTSPAAASRSMPCWGTSTTKRSRSPTRSTSPTTVSSRRRGRAARAVVPSAVQREQGGGAVLARRRMIVGSVAIFDGPVSRYVARTGVSMLSLEYRLAPEHPHPTPVEDAYAGLVWLTGHAAELGIDPGRIAVMGDSAGVGSLPASPSSAATGRARPWRASCSSTRCSTIARRRPTRTSRRWPVVI